MYELKWYENLTYNEAKDILQEKMENMKQNFIAAGYYLKYIRDNKLYLEDGYQTIWEFAEDNYGIKMSTASRWMSMNDKFSDGGNSPCLAEQYKEFGKSQLQEMLYLTDDQMEQAAPEMSAKEIRAIRKPEEKGCTVAEDEQCPVAKEEPVAPAQEELLSVLGYPKKVIKEDSLINSPGCEKHECWNCHRSGCDIRQEDCWCVDAPCGNPFACTTINAIDNLKDEIGERCQFVNLELADVRAGDKEPVPCCKKCSNPCEYECRRSVEKRNSEINSSGSVAPAQKIDESATCPPGVNECIRKEWGVTEAQQKAGAEECKKCWAKYKKHKKLEEPSDQDKDTVDDEAVVIEQVEEIEDVEVVQDVEDDTDQLSLIRSMLARENKKLEEFIKVNAVDPLPERMLEEKKIIVAALAGMICDLEGQEDIPEPIQPPLPIMRNNDQRKEWLRNYKDWGLWYEDKNIDCRYYKYDFQDGSRLIVAEYPQRRKYWNHTELADEAYYHLLDKNRKWYGTNKTFEQQYMHSTDSETSLVEFLKILQKGEK